MKNSFAGKNGFSLFGCFSNLLQNFCALREKMTPSVWCWFGAGPHKNDSERLVLGLVLAFGAAFRPGTEKSPEKSLRAFGAGVWCRDVNKYFPAPLQHPCGMDTTNQKTV
jgi:hypothetical protein